MKLIAYQTYGSYQGEYLVVLEDKGILYFYMDSYGSCSGCDWLEAEKDWNTNEVDYKKALEYCLVIKTRDISVVEDELKEILQKEPRGTELISSLKIGD
jgi:hypothetical protein